MLLRYVTTKATTTIRYSALRLFATSASNSLAPPGASPQYSDLIPEDVVRELNKHIIGQDDAKRAVAIALRNRWRRQQLADDTLRSEISPMNILMSGPTGSGKTEIARRLAKLTDAPFVKVEATKFTEVGIYGANAESMIKDLVDVAVDMERTRATQQHAAAARKRAIDRLVDLLATPTTLSHSARAAMFEDIATGKADDRIVHVTLAPAAKRSTGSHHDQMAMDVPPELSNMLKHLDQLMQSKFATGGAPKSQRLRVADALPLLIAEETNLIVDDDAIIQLALQRVETHGIVFLDEIDKLATSDKIGGAYRKGDGVQKELLALTEGCAVRTRYGVVYTDHILFIASGAFHSTKPSDLLPELQGRLPIRVALLPLSTREFKRILTETEANLLVQTTALLATEGVELVFLEDAVDEIARVAALVNAQTDDIGARRLATIVAKITDDVSFYAPTMRGVNVQVDAKYVKERLANVLEKTDLQKFIL